jgi:uncharacterized protein
MSLNKKLLQLKKILSKMESVLLAYSGGSDSTFLLKVAKDTLGEKVLAVTAVSATYPKEELTLAKGLARLLQARHAIIRTQELRDDNFLNNPPNRCYFCKKELFSRLKYLASKHKLQFVIDATNSSDKKDFRPGSRAKKELGVRSPLEETGITKKEIRALSKKLGLSTWDKPALACLASRIPYGTKIDDRILQRIDRAERFLRLLGFTQVRLRHYNGLARIEVPKKDIPSLLSKKGLIVDRLKKIGYNYVTVDLEGYRTGSLNIGVR